MEGCNSAATSKRVLTCHISTRIRQASVLSSPPKRLTVCVIIHLPPNCKGWVLKQARYYPTILIKAAIMCNEALRITNFSASPCHLEVSVEADILKKVAFASRASAFASKVFPFPGGPYSRRPLAGDRRPWNRSALRAGKMTISWRACTQPDHLIPWKVEFWVWKGTLLNWIAACHKQHNLWSWQWPQGSTTNEKQTCFAFPRPAMSSHRTEGRLSRTSANINSLILVSPARLVFEEDPPCCMFLRSPCEACWTAPGRPCLADLRIRLWLLLLTCTPSSALSLYTICTLLGKPRSGHVRQTCPSLYQALDLRSLDKGINLWASSFPKALGLLSISADHPINGFGKRNEKHRVQTWFLSAPAIPRAHVSILRHCQTAGLGQSRQHPALGLPR